MNLGPYINELLFRYDCVIIPGFGGFVGNYAPARVHPVQHRFYPPCKRITFNRHLQNNDGLLANLIAQDTGNSFEKAMELIHSEVSLMEKNLREGQKVSIEKIGAFVMDIEKNIQFEPNLSSNYLLDSYGLLTFQVLPVEREVAEQESVKKESEVPVITIERKNQLAKYAKIAAAASILFAVVWIPLKTDLLEQAGVANTVSRVFRSEAPAYHQQPAAFKKEDLSIRQNNLNRELEQAGESIAWSFLDEEERADDTPEMVYIRPKPAEKAASPAPSAFVGPFHVVGGCFEYKENADKLVNRLRRKGFSAGIAGKRHDLYVVSYGSYSNRQDALQLLREVKRTENQQAWLLRK